MSMKRFWDKYYEQDKNGLVDDIEILINNKINSIISTPYLKYLSNCSYSSAFCFKPNLNKIKTNKTATKTNTIT